MAGDALREADEAVAATLTNPVGGTITQASAVAVVLNDDNDPPILMDDTVTTDEDTPVDIPVLGNDTDDGPGLTVTGASDPANGAVSVRAGGEIRYTPDADFHGTDSFTYTVRDADGVTATANVEVTVDPVDDAPVFTTDAAQSVDENESFVFRLGATDVDDDDAAITFAIAGGADAGRFTLTPEGDLSFRDAPDWEASDSADGDTLFDLQVTATSGAGAATQDLTVTVENVFESQNTETGTPGTDNLEGGDLEDEIRTGGGVFDRATGGGGLDVFVFDNAADGAQQQAYVTDYAPGEDAIDLQGTTVDYHASWAGVTYLFMNGTDYDMLAITGAASFDEITFVTL